MARNEARNTYRKLTENVWAEIRRQYLLGARPSALCRRFGISRSTLTSRRSAERWNEDLEAVQCLPRPTAASSQASADQRSPHTAGQIDEIAVPGDHLREPDVEQGPEGLLAHVRNTLSREAQAERATAITETHLALAESLRQCLDLLVLQSGAQIGTSPRPSRDALDLAAALEKVQRIERTALGLDAGGPLIATRAIIVLPPKMSLEEWEAEAEKYRQQRGPWPASTGSGR